MQEVIANGSYIEYLSLIGVLMLVGAVRTFTPNKSQVSSEHGMIANVFVNIVDTVITGTCAYAAVCVYMGIPFPLNTFVAIAIGWLGVRGTYHSALNIVNVIAKYRGNVYESPNEKKEVKKDEQVS